MSTPEILIYSGHRCAYCNAARRLLDSKGAEYTEINVDEDPELRKMNLIKLQVLTLLQD